jgi:DNA-damage-inducible protein D
LPGIPARKKGVTPADPFRVGIVVTNDNGKSPFDSIRRIDGNGNEFWCARELMPMLGYKQWQRFKGVIDNAAENIETITGSTVEHFLAVEIKNTDSEGNRLKGRTGIDYKLSRLACYHVALSCDSRGNDLVKAAKHYFAIKTREAETVVPAQIDAIRELELRLQLAQVERDRLIAEKAVLDTRHLIVSTCPEPVQQKILGYEVVREIEYRDRILDGDYLINDGSTINKTALCHRYGLLTRAGKPDYRRLNQYLERMPDDAFQLSATIQESYQLDRDFLPILDRVVDQSSRQMWFGET